MSEGFFSLATVTMVTAKKLFFLVTMATVAKEQNSIDGSLGFTKIHLVSKFGGNLKTTG